MKKFILLIILNLSLLFSPSPRQGTTEVCGRYVHITSFAGFNLNPDTYGFIFPSITPGLLFEKKIHRQSRPLFVLAGSAVGYSVYYITWPFHKYLRSFYKAFWTGTYPENETFMIGNFYLAFVLINILILWLSLYLFEKICGQLLPKNESADYSTFCMMVFIASNPVTKTFFWAVHQQMFALFTPLLCIHILLQITRRNNLLSLLDFLWMTFAGGVLLLVYGNFILLLPVLLYCLIRNHLQFANNKKWGSLVLKNAGAIIMFLLPTFIWIFILKLNGVTYFNFEIVNYRQLIWIKDTLSVSMGNFLDAFSKNTIEYLLTMRYLASFLAAAVILTAVLRIRFNKKDRVGKDFVFVFLCFFFFYWILGFYEERLTYTLVPILICLVIAISREKFHQKKMIYILGGLAITWHLYVLLSYGPFC